MVGSEPDSASTLSWAVHEARLGYLENLVAKLAQDVAELQEVKPVLNKIEESVAQILETTEKRNGTDDDEVA